jgi:hypothetical protein
LSPYEPGVVGGGGVVDVPSVLVAVPELSGVVARGSVEPAPVVVDVGTVFDTAMRRTT